MGKINVDFKGAIGKFESAMKRRLLIKSVFYKRVFGGKGFEFDSFRNYVAGNDDAALIDWKASMRGGNVLVRQYIEENDLNIFLLIDVGDNMIFGSGEKLKIETSAEISAALAHLILSSGDKLGFAMYNDKISSIRPSYSGMKQFYGFIKNISNTSLYGGKSNLRGAIDALRPYLNKSSAVFIISDFLRMDNETAKTLWAFMANHETIGIMVRDRVEEKLTDLDAEVVMEDIDSGEQIVVNPDLISNIYERNTRQQKQAVFDLFKKSGADLIALENNKEFTVPLVEFLKGRIKRRKSIS